jgi:hypothetical protein
MPHKLNSGIAVIGIDIGKNSFHVVGHDKRGAIMLRQRWSRGQVVFAGRHSQLATQMMCSDASLRFAQDRREQLDQLTGGLCADRPAETIHR